MKNLRTVVACICLVLCGSVATAQSNDHAPLNQPDPNKPKLFNGLPDRIPVSADYLNSLFDSPAGRNVTVLTSADRSTSSIEGRVISSESKYNDALKSVVIRSTNFNGAHFTVSRYTDAEGLVSYTGRIISMQHGDAYDLKTESGNLVLVKRKFQSLVNE
jgi:hypothetical protein